MEYEFFYQTLDIVKNSICRDELELKLFLSSGKKTHPKYRLFQMNFPRRESLRITYKRERSDKLLIRAFKHFIYIQASSRPHEKFLVTGAIPSKQCALALASKR